MTDTATQPEVSDEQIAEWNRLHNRIRELSEASRDAEREAGTTLAWGIRHPGSEEYAMKQALEEARRAVELWDERMALSVIVDAHPYTGVVRARIAAKAAAKAKVEA